MVGVDVVHGRVVHHQGHGGVVLRAVRIRAGQEAVRAVQRSHEIARGRLVTVAMVIDHRGQHEGAAALKVELLHSSRVEADSL